VSGNPGSEPAPKPSGADSDSEDTLKGDTSGSATEEQPDTVSGGAPEPTGDES
jgi:hypothetical protein